MASEAGVRRRWPDTLVAVAIGGGLFYWSRHLWVTDHGVWAFIVGWLAFAAITVAVMGPASGPCPLCGKLLHGLFAIKMGIPQRCDHCQLYFETSAEQKALPDDYVSSTPMFPVLLNTNKPSICCVCGNGATKVNEFYHKSEGRVSHASPLVQKLEVRAPMPYCDEHSDGVELGSEDFSPSQPFVDAVKKAFTEDNTPKSEMVLKVRSYRFYRASWGLLN